MSTQLITILETSPMSVFEEEIDLGNTLAIRYLIFTFDLILLSTLNHAKLQSVPLFSFLLDKFYSEVHLMVQNDFDFFHMRYDTKLNLTYPGAYVNSTSVFVDKYMHQEARSQSITIKYKLQGNEQILSAQRVKTKVHFGYLTVDEKKHFGRFTIQNFHYHLTDDKGKLIKSSGQQKHLRKQPKTNELADIFNNFEDDQNPALQNYNEQGNSFPVVYLAQLNNMKQDSNKEYFNNLISNLEPYNATDTTSKSDQLFICHDMKSGYEEDVKFSNNLLLKRSNSYRFNYLWHTGIFNYFSHKTISIPPRHWRQLCKKYKVKCLGTFIVEAQKVTEAYYVSNEFALKLIYLAKKHKFDGYLLNIENEVKDVQKLKTWLTFLRKRMHQEIPGSMISWYDSITVKGNIDYQNEINDNNKVFYELTDSFFTNYWWNDEKLKDDIKQAQPNKTIYVGNDVWGRGTFGGGQFFTFKGIDEIQKFNKPNEPNLVPALFAPGYTYESGGQNNNAYFKANQDRLYRGVIFEKYDIPNWQPLEDTHLQALSLDKQKQWSTSYYPESLWTYKNQKRLRVNFLFRIRENATQNTDIKTVDYKIMVRVRDVAQNKIIETGVTEERLNIPLTKTNIIRHVQMFIDGEKITPRSILQIIVATSIENVFDQKSRLVGMYDQALDWVANVPMSNIKFISPYNTFFNVGHGQAFFFKGKPIQQSYDYLADYDLPQTLSINHPFKTSIEHHDAYIGGSSLILNEQTINLFSIDLPSTQYNYPVSYQMKIASKGGPIDTVYISQTSGLSIFFDKTSENRLENGWVEETFELSKQNMKKMKKKFFKQLQTILSLTVKSKCLLGQVHLRPKMLDYKEQPQRKLQLIISQSFKTLNKDEIYISLKLNEMVLIPQAQSRRYLIKIGQEIGGFVYMQREGDKYRGKMDQIKIKLGDRKMRVEVIDVDQELREDLLIDDSVNLRELKLEPLSHKIRFTNY